MAQDWRGNALVYFCGAVDDLFGAVLHRHLDLEFVDMTREDIIRMARESGMAGFDGTVHAMFQLESFAALVAAAEREACLDVMMQSAAKGIDTAIALEREACAKVCEEVGVWPSLEPKHCADAIRARGQA